MTSREDPALRMYRRVLIVFVAVMAAAAIYKSVAWFVEGRAFQGVMALLVLGFLLLLIRGYRQDARDRE